MGQNSLFPENLLYSQRTNCKLLTKKKKKNSKYYSNYLKIVKKLFHSSKSKLPSITISSQLWKLKQKLFLPVENRLEPHEVIITPPPEEPRLSQASEGSEAASEAPSETSSPSGKTRRYRGDTSKRRKGVYITQWPESLDTDRNKLSAQSSEERDEPPATPSDLSDCEGHTPRR